MPSTIGIVASGRYFQPLNLSPRLWLDAADTSTITSSGSPAKVSQWNDKSGNGTNVTQSTSANQPQTGVNTVNGNNVLTCDGASLLVASSTSVLRNVSAATVYVVRQYTTSPTAERVTFQPQFSTNGLTIVLIGAGFTAHKPHIGGRTVDTDAFRRINGSTTLDASKIEIQTGWFDYANTDATQYINGSADGTSTSWGTNTTTQNVGINVNILNNSAGTAGITGYVGEILVYHAAHTEAQRGDVWGYLAGKWGIAL